ncbi:hypothetical protein GCM10027169_05460 [Gordonia jinhuaensis]|uniref:Uncharacterized protein n=1 Tax=Gordonia jinhuaensis TaxID=1517702 RepID=A0A916WPM6_9ACTN|nr:hypothetical protein [Gordonia jinhuaensis]GGB17842.1 hypothetical protein GCM10011489_02420 [Gordonia jinhuaensis]
MTHAVVAAAGTILAASDQQQGPEFGKASPLGLLIIVVLLVATVFLIWSMNKRLRKLPKDFDPSDPGPDQELDEATDRQATDRTATDARSSATGRPRTPSTSEPGSDSDSSTDVLDAGRSGENAPAGLGSASSERGSDDRSGQAR